MPCYRTIHHTRWTRTPRPNQNHGGESDAYTKEYDTLQLIMGGDDRVYGDVGESLLYESDTTDLYGRPPQRLCHCAVPSCPGEYAAYPLKKAAKGIRPVPRARPEAHPVAPAPEVPEAPELPEAPAPMH